MNIICISDTHNQHERLQIPPADVIVHAGDITEGGTLRELKKFFSWFSNLPHAHKICIAGNHDFYLEGLSETELKKVIPKNVHYLLESGVTINNINLWGSPYTPVTNRWAFGKNPHQMKLHWKKIPPATDILITHTPPFDILDEAESRQALGCKYLREEVDKSSTKFHVFGHVHNNYGIVKFSETTFVNATSFTQGFDLANVPLQLNI